MDVGVVDLATRVGRWNAIILVLWKMLCFAKKCAHMENKCGVWYNKQQNLTSCFWREAFNCPDSFRIFNSDPSSTCPEFCNFARAFTPADNQSIFSSLRPWARSLSTSSANDPTSAKTFRTRWASSMPREKWCSACCSRCEFLMIICFTLFVTQMTIFNHVYFDQ